MAYQRHHQVDLIDVEIDGRQLMALLDATEKEYRVAVPRVMNRRLVRAAGRIARDVSAQTGVKPTKLIRRRIRIVKALARQHAGAIKILVNPVSVIRIAGTRQIKRKGGGVAVPGVAGYIGAFIARKRGTVTDQVFRRKGPERLPLQAIKIDIEPTARVVMQRHMDDVEQGAVDDLERELRYRIGLRVPGGVA